MQFLLDHFGAMLIGSVMVIILSVAQMRTGHAGIEQVVTHSARAKTLVFGHWIERDILDIGENFGRNRYRFERPTNDARGNTVAWQFYSDSILAGGGVIRQATRYRLITTDSVVVRSYATGNDTLRTLYRLDRFRASVVNPPEPFTLPESDWTQDAQSVQTLSFFEVAMLERDGSVTVNQSDADYIRVRFAVLPEIILRPENYLRELYWVTTLKVRPFWDPPVTTTPTGGGSPTEEGGSGA
jgi:hypothetical protein